MPDWTLEADELRRTIRRGGGLVSRAGMAKRWGRSRQRVWQLSRLDTFPAPVCGITDTGLGDELWLWNEVDEWREARAGATTRKVKA